MSKEVMTKDQIEAQLRERGYTIMSYAMNGSEYISINAAHIDHDIGVTVNLRDESFEVYSMVRSTYITSRNCSPFHRQDHFERIEREIKRAVHAVKEEFENGPR